MPQSRARQWRTNGDLSNNTDSGVKRICDRGSGTRNPDFSIACLFLQSNAWGASSIELAPACVEGRVAVLVDHGEG
jgi:hypothetical protein